MSDGMWVNSSRRSSGGSLADYAARVCLVQVMLVTMLVAFALLLSCTKCNHAPSILVTKSLRYRSPSSGYPLTHVNVRLARTAH